MGRMKATLSKIVVPLALLVIDGALLKSAHADAPEGPSDWIPGYYSPGTADPYAYAESPFGPGIWGANRRLESDAGYGSVSGTFSHSAMSIYKDPDKNFPRNPNAGESEADFLQRRNAYHRNKPTFYFGAHAPKFIVDSGMQWEEFDMGTPTNPFPRGWSLFVSIRSTSEEAWPNVDGYTCWNWRQFSTGLMENELGNTSMEFAIQ